MPVRKLIVFNLVTLDGYFAGPNGDIDWHQVDEEFFEFSNEQLATIDAILFGRVTYDGMAGYWPTPPHRSPTR
jgi:dihydrofolate reductase